MSFLDSIEKFQKKPERTKRKLLFVILSISMALLVFIWINNLRSAITEESNQNRTPSPFGVLWNSFTSGFDELRKNAFKK